MEKRHRAGEPVDDRCRACKALRRHTVMAVDGDGRVLRVVCDFCGSQHNFRGGGEDGRSASPTRAPESGGSRSAAGDPFPVVSPRERSLPPVSLESTGDLEMLLRRVLREEGGLTPVVPAAKWRGGTLVLRPGTPGLQDKEWPIETFFHKVVMIRNRLRTLEQQVNSAELSEEAKVKLQAYVTACYGSLTSFNILFAEEDDRFQGQGE